MESREKLIISKPTTRPKTCQCYPLACETIIEQITKKGAEPQGRTTNCLSKTRCVTGFHPQTPVILYEASVPGFSLTKESYWSTLTQIFQGFFDILHI